MFADRLSRARNRRTHDVGEKGLPAVPAGAAPADELDLDDVVGGYPDSPTYVDFTITLSCGATPPQTQDTPCVTA